LTTPTFLYLQVIDEFIKKYDYHQKLGETLEISKKETVIKLKELLIKEAEMDKKPIDPEKISAKITNDLKGRISGTYIREILGPEFKDQSKVREQKPVIRQPVMVTTTGEAAEPEPEEKEDSPPPKGESKAEMNRRIRENWRKNPYAKLTKSVGAKQEKAYKKKDEEQERKSGGYTGPSIGPKEEVVEEEQETSYFITITDTDIIDEIVLLRTQQNVMRIRLEVDAADRTVMGIRQNR
jgi:hypothetical protein